MMLFAQTPILPEPPKTIDGLATYLLYVVLLLGLAALVYMVNAVRDKEKGRDKAYDKMVETMEKVISKYDERHEKLATMHDKDREAFLTTNARLEGAISQNTAAVSALVQKISTRSDHG